MDNNIQIVDISDVDELYLIEKKTYKSPWNKKHFESDIKNKLSLNYSYKKNNQLIGYLFGYLIEREYHLNKITVENIHRQKKIGRELFDYCLKELINKNVKCIQLEVSSLNLIAQKFYKSLNFIQVGRRKKYYSDHDDALLYNLEI